MSRLCFIYTVTLTKSLLFLGGLLYICCMEGKNLISLAEHNAEASLVQFRMNDNSPQFNRIACPQCGKELMDTTPNATLTSNPAQKDIHCPECGYVGYRIA